MFLYLNLNLLQVFLEFSLHAGDAQSRTEVEWYLSIWTWDYKMVLKPWRCVELINWPVCVLALEHHAYCLILHRRLPIPKDWSTKLNRFCQQYNYILPHTPTHTHIDTPVVYQAPPPLLYTLLPNPACIISQCGEGGHGWRTLWYCQYIGSISDPSYLRYARKRTTFAIVRYRNLILGTFVGNTTLQFSCKISYRPLNIP